MNKERKCGEAFLLNPTYAEKVEKIHYVYERTLAAMMKLDKKK